MSHRWTPDHMTQAGRFAAKEGAPLTLTHLDLVTRRDFGRLGLGAGIAAGGLMGGGLLIGHGARADDMTVLGSVARVEKISGATHDNDSRSLTTGDKVYRGDLLWTRSHGQLRIDLLDGSNLSLGENAEVALDDSMQSGGGSAFMRALSGAFRFNSGGAEKAPTPPRIETPFAVLSLRGTEVYGAYFGKALGIFVAEGQVEVSNDSDQVILNAGEGTEIYSRGAKMEKPKPWGAAKIKHTKGLFRF